MNEIDLSIVVVNRNTRDLLRRCLDSVFAATSPPRVEVIVVDNGSSDGSDAMVATDYPAATLIRNEENTGFAVANNQGIARSRGRHVMLLNSDTEVDRDSLERLVRYLDENPGVGVVAPALFYPDGSIQRSAFSFDTPWRHFADMLALGRLFPRSRLFANLHWRFDFERTALVDWVIGAAMVVRREVIDEVGVLDERFRIHCNDSDWCYRIHRAGHEIVFVHDARVMHHSGATLSRERVRETVETELIQNLFAYYRKHYGRLGLAWFRLWAAVGFGVRYGRARRRDLDRVDGGGTTHQTLDLRRKLRAVALGGAAAQPGGAERNESETTALFVESR